MKIKVLFLSGLGLLAGASSFAQTVAGKQCLSQKYSQEIMAALPGNRQQPPVSENQIQQFVSQQPELRQASGVVTRIPVVIHVVTKSGCNGISKAQVLNGLEVLNQDFRRQNPDTVNTRAIFKPYAADTEIEFVLARTDPNGLPTEGINRVTSPTATGAPNRDDVKLAVPAWPTNKYLNIWLVEGIYDAQVGTNILGYSYFPNIQAMQPGIFGVVLEHTAWGKQGGTPGSTANTNGHYATHEVSHCLNLSHILDADVINGVVQCTLPNGACGFGDGVADTPPSNPVASSATCDFTLNTCHSDVACSSFTSDVPDMIENYQYLSSENCQNMFTTGQKMRMQAALNLYPFLQNLVSPANAAATGIDPNAPVGSLLATPYFCVDNQRICAGNTVTFSDRSYGAAATNWNWTFPGGTPATSNLQHPVVTYNTPGEYNVTLHVGSALGISTNTWTNHIKVVPTTGLFPLNYTNFYQESFEEATFPVSATANRTWEKATSSLAANPETWTRVSLPYTLSGSASGGTHSLRLQNANLPAGTVSTLITPNFTNPGNLPSSVFMYLAYAKRNAQPAEVLKVFYSHDCGITWNGPVKTMMGNQLVTNGGAQVTNFVPQAGEWRLENLVNPNNIYTIFGTAPHVMFKIEVTSNGGGNLYVDNFSIGTVLGTKEVANAQNIRLFPNPLTAETGIHFELQTPETGTLNIFDLVGNNVYAGQETTLGAGKHSVLLGERKLSSGVYLVQLQLGGQLYRSKLLVP